jgi:hypothetical protein
LLHYSIDGGEYTISPIVHVAGDDYQASLPALDCGSNVAFYLSVEEEYSGLRKYWPEPDSPLTAQAVTDELLLFEDDFEVNGGWVSSGGLWERGIPLGLGGEELQYPAPDPVEGCNGTAVMGYNLSGDYENNLPETHITSPAIDCTDMENVHLKFCRWLAVEGPGYDHARVQASNDGTVWETLWENPATIADLDWTEIDFDLSAIADHQATVYVRWTMGPTDGGLVYAGWNIDNVRLVSLVCQSFLCGDVDNSETVDISDLTYFVEYLFGGGPAPVYSEAADVDGSPDTNISDLTYMVDYFFGSGPSPVCH